MNKLKSDPHSFMEKFNDSTADPVFQMRLMRAFAERHINPLDVVNTRYLSSDSNLQLCIRAYAELKQMEAALLAYPEQLDHLEEVSKNNRLFKVADELFPVGGNCIRGSSYVDNCLDQPLSSKPAIVFLHGLSTPQRDKKGVFFILASQLYLCKLWPLLFFNASTYQSSFIVHVHIVNPDISFLSDLVRIAPSNIIFTSSEVDTKRPHMTPYYHALRYLLLPIILGIHKLPVILLGADVVFSDIADCLVDSKPHCVGLYRGQNPEPFKTPWNHACGDLVVIPFTPEGRLFSKGVSNYIDSVDTIKQHTLYLDQAALTMTFNRMHFYRNIDLFFDPKVEIKSICNLNSRGSLPEKLSNALLWHDSVTNSTKATDYCSSLESQLSSLANNS